MSKVEDIIAATKLNELINKKEESSQSRTVLWVLAIVGAVAAVAAIAQYTVSLHRIIWRILKKTLRMILMMTSSMMMTRYKKVTV